MHSNICFYDNINLFKENYIGKFFLKKISFVDLKTLGALKKTYLLVKTWNDQTPNFSTNNYNQKKR